MAVAEHAGTHPTGVAGLPTHELIYRALRDRILFGDLAPGQAVTIQGLTQELGAGMTPVREAIRRLTTEGALEFQGNRRVSVPELSAQHIDEIIIARQWLDPHLAGLATRNATPADIAELTRIDARLDSAINKGDLRGYLAYNYAFHRRLYDLAQSPILAALADQLWLRYGPSMRVVCGRLGTQNLPDRHKQALAAMQARDPDAVGDAIREDVLQGMELVRQSVL